MKVKKVTCLLMILFSILLYSSCQESQVAVESETKDEQMQTRSVEDDISILGYYNYPLLQNVDNWKQLQSHQERIKACLIPKELANSMSDVQLARTCVEFPMAFFFIFHNDERLYLSKMIQEFNGYQYLLDRKKGIKEFVNLYKCAKHPQLASPESNYSSSFIFSYFELLLSDDAFFTKLTYEDKIELKKAALEKIEIELSDNEWFSFYSYRRTFLLLSRVICDISASLSDEEKKVLVDFINNYAQCELEKLEEVSKIITSK